MQITNVNRLTAKQQYDLQPHSSSEKMTIPHSKSLLQKTKFYSKYDYGSVMVSGK